jgi:hypothetical protein
MIQISLITSLYRSAAFLPTYQRQVSAVANQLAQAQLTLELLLVSNDPTREEELLLNQFAAQLATQHPNVTLQRINTARETLYASWNRALAQMQGEVFGMWNVDDVRHGDALIAAYRGLRQGATLVDAPMRIVRSYRLGGVTLWRRSYQTPLIYHPEIFTRKQTISPFALMHRDLYAQVGGYDPHFKVSGDIEWGYRARGYARFAPLTIPGGTFYLHGANLSSTGGELQQVEDNIVFMRAQLWDQVRPTPAPELMQRLWLEWGNPHGIVVPDAVAACLWGAEAQANWTQWQREHQRHLRRLFWRALPRTLINRLRLRTSLARLGIVKKSS